MTSTLSFKDPAAKITTIYVERVRNHDDETGKDYVAYHKFVRAEGIDVRDGAPVEIDFTIPLRGAEVNALNNVRITPAKWRDDMFDICRSHAVRADRLGIPQATYVPMDAEPAPEQPN